MLIYGGFTFGSVSSKQRALKSTHIWRKAGVLYSRKKKLLGREMHSISCDYDYSWLPHENLALLYHSINCEQHNTSYVKSIVLSVLCPVPFQSTQYSTCWWYYFPTRLRIVWLTTSFQIFCQIVRYTYLPYKALCHLYLPYLTCFCAIWWSED